MTTRLARFSFVSAITVTAIFGATQALAAPDISVYLGFQQAGNSDINGNDPAGVGAFSFPASWDGKSFEAPPHYGIRATWWQTERFGWAVDFNHTKIYGSDSTLASSGFSTLEFTDGLNNLTVGPVWRWPTADGRWTPYAGVGAGIVIPHVEVQTAAAAPETLGYQVAGPSVAWNAGIQYAVNDRWAIFGEYKGTYSWIDADLDGGGSIDFEVDTHAINFGVTYRFN
ncbi:porin family protein [Aliishimia ponticola]|uniref:Porin family protein n=1 Tax=Aliishimia ponticola TaxID=2499833 RepID=A0A4V3XK91_9RHOB|nr:outer membrane beta-barrel protein [Aliishimia ponticola]THH36033.1 porin family protein [Aliishimia ponticola]